MRDTVQLARVRRATHAVHAVTSLVLIATGLLIEWPDLRARLIGGYGLQLSAAHRWTGAVFALAPVLAAAVAGRPLVRDLQSRLGPGDRLSWRRAHAVGTGLLTLLLAGTGAVLWVAPDVSLAILDATAQVHLVSTWLVIASLPVHLFAARLRIASVAGMALARGRRA